MNEDEQLEPQNQPESESPELITPAEPVPSTVSFSEEQMQRALGLQSRNVERALEAARFAREDNERLRQQYESRNVQPTYDFQEMNHRATNGQFAEVQADIVRSEMQRMMAPLLAENAASKRERNIAGMVDAAISGHIYSGFVNQGREHLITYVKGSLGNREPDEFIVKSLIDGAIGQAMMQNPSMISDYYGGQNQSASANPASSPSKPIPHRIPTSRPLVSSAPGGASILDEAEKRIKAQNPDWAKMSDEDWKDDFYAPDQILSFDLNKIMKK